MKINCIVDDKGYKVKPEGAEVGVISNRLSKGTYQSLEVEEFAGTLGSGKTYLSGHLIDRSLGRKKTNFTNINMFSLDVDNKIGKGEEAIYTNYTILEATEQVERLLNITPIISYITFSKSNPNGSDRFRLIYGIDDLCSNKEVETLIEYILELSGDMFDLSCKDASRMFYGTSERVISYQDHKLLDPYIIDKLSDLIDHEEIKVKKKDLKKATQYDSQYTDDVVEELKQVDLGDYLRSRGYAVKDKVSGYKMACPIHHGVNDNFSIEYHQGAWLYNCFSGCGGKGGTIIDLHMALNNLEVGQAIKELCEIYNIKPTQRFLEEADTYTIDKYIGQDYEASKGILEAVKDNKKTLLTGGMGSGKTHFIIKELYKYTKEINKTLIMIIPSTNQLDNIFYSYGIETVCGGSGYIGDDIVATTPESLPKITKELDPDSYILVVDESHERITSLYRRGYSNNNIEKAEKHAYRSLHITATPRVLSHDNFNKVIKIKTKKPISNNIQILKVKDKLDDKMLYVIEKLIKAGKKPILFNNNKEINNIMADLLEEKETVTIAEYEEGQLNLYRADDPVYKDHLMDLVSTETIESGKKSDNIAKGQVKKDITLTTSAIQSGIDLYTDKDAVLVINTKGTLIDNIIQVIGRFRTGIEVYLIVQDPEEAKDTFNLEYSISRSLEGSQAMADLINTNKAVDYLLEDQEGLKEKAHLKKENGTWIVNKNSLIASIYKKWSRSILNNIDELIKVLKDQDAFNVKDIRIKAIYDELEIRVSEVKKITREERKEKIDKIKDIMLALPDDQLAEVLVRDYKNIDEEQAEKIQEYFKIAHSHIDKIKEARDQLYTDDIGIRDSVKAFRRFYSSKWTDISREIEEGKARRINRLIKDNGLDLYLSKEASGYKTSIDIMQAKIRAELMDLEKKQGRISQDRIDQLMYKLKDEGYIYNKYTKILDAEGSGEQDRKKALKCLGDITKQKIENIYNFDTSGKLQSPKI